MKSYKLFLFFAALFGLLAVIIGSLASHVLDKELTEEALKRVSTAQEYQFYHVAALLGVGTLGSLHRNHDSITLKLAGFFFLLGILLFSGSLYALVLTENDVFGKIMPFGGVSFMLGWLFLVFFAFRR